MILSTRYAGRVAIIDVHGSLTLSPATNRMSRRIESLLSAKLPTGLILNLAEVPMIDSAGLGELMKIHTFATRHGMKIALLKAKPRIVEVLEVTRLDGLLPICDDEASALEQVSQS